MRLWWAAEQAGLKSAILKEENSEVAEAALLELEEKNNLTLHPVH